MFVWFCMLALADPGLSIERARMASQQGRVAEALEHVITALEEAPTLAEAHEVYINVMAKASLHERARIERALFSEAVQPQVEERTAFFRALRGHDEAAVRQAVETLITAHPDRPDWLRYLWLNGAPHAHVGVPVIRQLTERRRLRRMSTAGVYRLLRMWHYVPQDADDPRGVSVHDVYRELARRGETLPPSRPPMNRDELDPLAETLARAKSPKIQGEYEWEMVALASRVAERLVAQGRTGAAIRVLRGTNVGLRTDELYRLEAEIHLEAGDADALVELANALLRDVATAPSSTDFAVHDALERARLMGMGHRYRAFGHHLAGDPRRALPDLVLATTFGGSVRAERRAPIVEAGRAAEPTIRAPYDGGADAPYVEALTQADAALEAGDHAAATVHFLNARFLLVATPGAPCVEDPAPCRVALARLHGAWIPRLSTDTRELRTAYVQAMYLLGVASVGWWEGRAAAHAALGERNAAFESGTQAMALGSAITSEQVAAQFTGIGDGIEVARAMVRFQGLGGGLDGSLRAAEEQLLASFRQASGHDDDGLQRLALAAYMDGELTAALDYYDEIEADGKVPPGALTGRGIVYKRLRRYADEEAVYRQQQNAMPAGPILTLNLALCLAHQGRHDEARALFRELSIAQPEEPYHELYRAMAAAERGDDSAALHHLRQAWEGFPRLPVEHRLEFRQDVQLDPSFDRLRDTAAFHEARAAILGEPAAE